MECGKSLRKIGQSERDLLEKTISRFVNPLENFLESDIKVIMVTIFQIMITLNFNGFHRILYLLKHF